MKAKELFTRLQAAADARAKQVKKHFAAMRNTVRDMRLEWRMKHRNPAAYARYKAELQDVKAGKVSLVCPELVRVAKQIMAALGDVMEPVARMFAMLWQVLAAVIVVSYEEPRRQKSWLRTDTDQPRARPGYMLKAAIMSYWLNLV